MTCNQIRFVYTLSETMAKILRSNVSGFAAHRDKILSGCRRTGNLGEGGSRRAQQRDTSAGNSKGKFHKVLRKSGGDWYCLQLKWKKHFSKSYTLFTKINKLKGEHHV